MSRISTDLAGRHNNRNFSVIESKVDTLFKAGALFTARGFSHSTIKALVLGGINAPERLLFADETDLRSIRGLDEAALEEIGRYRTQFGTARPRQTLNFPSVTLRGRAGLRAD